MDKLILPDNKLPLLNIICGKRQWLLIKGSVRAFVFGKKVGQVY